MWPLNSWKVTVQSRVTSCVTESMGLCTAAGPLQLTLAILKPDLVQHPPNLRQVHRIIIEQDFLVIRSKEPSNNDINQS